MNMTYVSAYYHVPKRKMPHMGIARYIQLAPETLKMISGSKLVFYYEEDFIGALFLRLAENLNVDIDLVQRRIEDLPSREYAKLISESAKMPDSPEWVSSGKEKGISHLRGMDVNGDRKEYFDNLSIWLSKIDLVSEATDRDEVESQPFAWIDVGVAKKNFSRENWDFSQLCAEEGRLIHYSSEMRYLGKTLPINASFLKGWADEWRHLASMFSGKLSAQIPDGYPHDEETILSHVVEENPKLFSCAGNSFRGPFRKFRYYYHRLNGRRVRN